MPKPDTAAETASPPSRPPPGDVNPSNLEYVEGLYDEYLRDPAGLPESWRRYFDELTGGRKAPLGHPSFRARSIFDPGGAGGPAAGGASALNGRPRLPSAAPTAADELQLSRLQERVDKLVRSYRVRGHMVARLDPLGTPRERQPELTLKYHGFAPEHLDLPFSARAIGGENVQTLRQIVRRLRTTYCRWIGVQFMHIDDDDLRGWLQRRMEVSQNRARLSREEQLRILTKLTDAVIFEEFIRKTFVGAKSFSLEGAESLLPLLELAIETAAEQGTQEIVLGMAHRGRLNVLANLLGKSPQQIIREFQGHPPPGDTSASDVKYHLGQSSDWVTSAGKKVHLSLCFNPSHLEYVNPVALGRMRAKQDRSGDAERRRGMVVLIHGDAAFIGEGVTQETLNLSQLPGYQVGGALHVVVNNQIGFTTSPQEGRSTTYATDVAKMLQSPIFHVNGENPEAVAQVVKTAMDFRQRFRRDVVIDMYGYRRWGHNEGDEPSFTQPVVYRAIEQRESTRDSYLGHLLKLGEVTREEADEIAKRRREVLEQAHSEVRQNGIAEPSAPSPGIWEGYHGGHENFEDDVETGVEADALRGLLRKLTDLPDGFHLHPKLKRAWETRRKMANGEKPIDWSAAEALAMGSLAVEGHRVRLSGQDSARGTFSQRHAVLHDTQDDRTFVPLQHLSPEQAAVEVINSPLSESGVLGFDYGYSLDCPEGLVMWEAQFGDFVNAGQVIIDQFIASAEDKWRRLSGLVLLLPHGFEGQGPEHSSARLERFLSLAAEENLQIVYPTTPAQYFHCLRRQVVRRWRKPLVVMTPKSLLRHGRCTSSLEELACGRFRRVIADERIKAADAKRVLLCSGKVYYDLLKRVEEQERADVALVRLEQLYPLPLPKLADALRPYADSTPVYWVQEEPANMGAAWYLQVNFGHRLLGRFDWSIIAREESASPATGFSGRHAEEQESLLKQAVP
jgi:2-oxoglutarate dehydrogenase E1 component